MKKFTIIGLMMFLGMIGCSTVPETINNNGDGGISTSGDTSAPALYIMKPSGNITNQTYSYSVEGLAIDNDEIDAVYISRNSSAYTKTDGTGNWSTNITDLAIGDNIINVYALDKSGNTSLTQSVNIFVDTDAPVVSITSGPSSDLVTNSGFSITLDVDKNYGYYSVYGMPFIQFSEGTINMDITETTTLKYYGSDGINTSSTQTVNYGILNTNAPIVILNPSNDIITNETFTATLSINEDYGYWSTNGSPFVQFTTVGTSIDIGGCVELQYFGADIAGNTTSTQSVVYSVVIGDTMYISASGNDENNGYTKSTSLKTIQKAIEIAELHKDFGVTNVYVEAGVYTQGAGLSNTVAGNNYAGVNISNANNINLIGGWNINFTARTGSSVLDGGGASVSKHIIWVQDTTNLTIDGFVIRNANANGSYGSYLDKGGGIHFNNVSYSLIINCNINNNTASYDGGGVYVNGNYNTISGTICYNTAEYEVGGGGGVYVNGSYNTISGTIHFNYAYDSGGGVYVSGNYNTISGIIKENFVEYYGGGVCVCGTSNTISGTIEDNNASLLGGGGVSVSGDYNIISGTISDNEVYDEAHGTVGWYGGGVYVSGNYTTISGTIENNGYTRYGGGVYVEVDSLYNTISGTIAGNGAIYGGGVYNNGSTYWTGDWGSGNSPNNWDGNDPL